MTNSHNPTLKYAPTEEHKKRIAFHKYVRAVAERIAELKAGDA